MQHGIDILQLWDAAGTFAKGVIVGHGDHVALVADDRDHRS